MRLIALLVLVGCGDNLVAGEAAEDRSGTRLKLGWREYEDGARELADRTRMFDAELGADCELLAWADGVVRCTPLFDRFGSAEPFARVIFTNATCTARVGSTLFYPATLAFAAEWIGERLVPSQIFQVGRVVPAPPATFELRDGACVPVMPLPQRVHFELGFELPLEHLVAMTRTKLHASGRLAHIADLGDDGSSLWHGYHDNVLGVDCGLLDTGTLRQPCVPFDVYRIDLYTDAACSDPLTTVSPDDPAPRFAASIVDDVPTGYFEIAERYTGIVYQRSLGECVHVDAPDAVHRIGQQLVLADVTRKHVGGRRLADIVFVHDDLASPVTGLFDTRYHSQCRGFPFDRCIPLTLGVDEHFTTPACDVKTKVAFPPEITGVDRYSIASTGGEAFFELGGPITIYRGADCAPDRIPRRALGPVFGYEAFESARLVIDP